ncbi:MAG: HD domain-containing protein [Actinomycetota bacterium]
MTTDTKGPSWQPTGLLEKALVQATTWHAGQSRKVEAEPYIGHLLGVASLVIEHGGNEGQVCAALLHDSIEDCGVTTEELKNLFGPDIAAMVLACTDTDPDLPAPQDKTTKALHWSDRKETYHAAIRAKAALGEDSAERRAILVGICDKINNCEKSVNDSRGRDAEVFWAPFNAGGTCQEWNYRALLAAYREAAPIKAEVPGLRRALDRLERAINELFPAGRVPTCTVQHSHGPDAGGRR